MTRKQAPKFLKSAMTGKYYRVTKYTDLGGGKFIADEKEEITEQQYREANHAK